MAGKIKNKAGGGWISKVSNRIKSMLQEDKEFWGPAAIALGATAFSNSFTISPTGFNIIPYSGWVNFVVGIVLLLYGWTTPKNRKIWSRILILFGFSSFFIGIRIVSANLIMLITGWVIIIGSLILLGRGFYLYCKDRVDSRDKERGQG